MRILQMMFWRFLPPFVADPKTFKRSTINAKGETLTQGDFWKDSFLHRRCLVPIDSFVEWHNKGKSRLPWLFGMADDGIFALGGIWRHWRSPDGETQMDTFAIITTEANELVLDKPGMIVCQSIIKQQDYQRRLEPGDEQRPPIDLIRLFDSEKMKAWRVEQKINSVKNNGPELCEPKEDDGQMGMFDI
jgi:putative SOS response-associated peptidase YedK